jgi:hypothetical protein
LRKLLNHVCLAAHQAKELGRARLHQLVPKLVVARVRESYLLFAGSFQSALSQQDQPWLAVRLVSPLLHQLWRVLDYQLFEVQLPTVKQQDLGAVEFRQLLLQLEFPHQQMLDKSLESKPLLIERLPQNLTIANPNWHVREQ